MITMARTLTITYEELNSMFSKALDKEIENWKKEKEEFFNDPFNDEGRATGKYMPSATFQIWLNLPRKMVGDNIVDNLVEDIKKSGWEVKCKWIKNERTYSDQLYFIIEY